MSIVRYLIIEKFKNILPTKYMENKVVLFDIDYTLFNTNLFREKVYPRLANKLGYQSEEFYRLARDIEKILKEKQGHFSPEAFLSELSERVSTSVNKEELAAIMSNEAVYSGSLYEKVTDVLEALGTKGIVIGILSTGNDTFQRRKIQSIAHKLSEEHIHIFVDKVKELRQVFERYEGYKMYFVDDLPHVLASAKNIDDRVTTIWIKADKHYKRHDTIEDFTPDMTIQEISEVVDIVLNA